MRPEMITQIIRKLLFCVTGVRANGKLSPRQLLCVIGAFADSTYEGARITQENSCQKPCVTDVLCNCESTPK